MNFFTLLLIASDKWKKKIRIMKLTCLFVLIGLLQVNATSYGQAEKVTLDFTNVEIQKVFEAIQRQTALTFIYSNEDLSGQETTSVSLANEPVELALLQILNPFNLEFEISNQYVMIKKGPKPVYTITGNVTGENGEPLIGATILFMGKNQGTATDFDGNYKLEMSDTEAATAQLQFSYTGYRDEIVSVEGQRVINVVLKEAIASLDEVLVVGYGTTKRKDLTGSIGSVNSEEILQYKSATVDQSLVGQISGVFVESNAGSPGSGATINIRGLSQINGDNQPLYVVDGVPIVVNTNFGTFAGAGNRENPLLAIDPSNIEQIDVLKDASSAAIYGSRAANGVIMITTKRGRRNQAPQFNLSYSTSTLSPTNRINYLDANGYREFATALSQTELENFPRPIEQFPRFFPDQDEILNAPATYFGNANTNWEDEILNDNALWHQINFGVSGGTNKTNYLVSASLNDQDGLMLGNNFKQYSFNTNFDADLKDYFRIGTSISYAYGVNNQSGLSSLSLGSFRPDLPIFNEDGSPSQVLFARRRRVRFNPLADQGKIQDKATSQNVLGSLYGEVKLANNLKFRSQINVNLTNDNSAVFSPSFTGTANLAELRGGPGGALLNKQITDGYTTSWNNTLNYETTINSDHKIGAVVGLGFDRSYLNVEAQEYAGFPDDEFITNVNSANSVTAYSSSTIESALNSVFGRINYNFRDKYLLTLTARSDASTKFGPDNRRGFFPSAGIAWNVHNEAFVADSPVLNQLKFRASIGRTGSDNLPAFSYLPIYNTLGLGSLYDGINGIAVNGVPNPSIKWETTDQLDLGVEFALFDYRLTGEVAYFQKRTSDLILFAPTSSQTGSQIYNANIADVTNTGYEFTIGRRLVRTKKIVWNTSFNITFLDNVVDALNGGTNENNPFLPPLNSIKEGEPIGFILGYEVESIAQSAEEIQALNAGAPNGRYFNNLRAPGDYIFKDLNGDGEINASDLTNLGDINPDFYGGWNNMLTYNNFELGFNFQFVSGNSRLWNIPGRLAAVDITQNQTDLVNDTWTPNNTGATYARIGSRTHRDNSSMDVEDGSYARLRYLSLGYVLPKNLVKRLGFSFARITVSGNNLLTFTNYQGQDPESVSVAPGGATISRNIDNDFNYPLAKMMTFNVELKF